MEEGHRQEEVVEEGDHLLEGVVVEEELVPLDLVVGEEEGVVGLLQTLEEVVVEVEGPFLLLEEGVVVEGEVLLPLVGVEEEVVVQGTVLLFR